MNVPLSRTLARTGRLFLITLSAAAMLSSTAATADAQQRQGQRPPRNPPFTSWSGRSTKNFKWSNPLR